MAAVYLELAENALSTLSLMNNYPVGASVLPKNTPQAREQFEPIGWWHEPAVVVGYDTITYKQELITLCQIRTQRGEGHLLAVNPTWLEAPLRHSAHRSHLLTNFYLLLTQPSARALSILCR